MLKICLEKVWKSLVLWPFLEIRGDFAYHSIAILLEGALLYTKQCSPPGFFIVCR